MSRMHVSKESKETPLHFDSFKGPLDTKSVSPRPAKKDGSVPRDDCFDAFNAPKPPTACPNKDQLNLFNANKNAENIPPATSRPCRDPNAQSTEEQTGHSKCVGGVKRVDTPTIVEAGPTGIKMVENGGQRTVSVVGEAAAAPATSPAPNRSVSPRPNSASTPMGTVLTMDKQLLTHTGAVDVVGTARQRSLSIPVGTKRTRELSAAEKIIQDVCTNVAARHGSVANFFFHLARGTVGHLGTLEQSKGAKIPVDSLREQLCAVITTDIDVPTFNAIFFGEGVEEDKAPKFVSFAEFTKAFPDTR